MWENKENDDTGWFLLASLDKLTEEKNELCDKSNQLLALKNMVKDSGLSDKTGQFQVHMSSLKVSKCALEEHLLSSTHRAQAVENQTRALIIGVAELQ